MPIGPELALNELSLENRARSIDIARERMCELVGTIQRAVHYGASRSVRTLRSFYSAELASGYPVARWRHDAGVDGVTRELFLSLTVAAPYLDDLEAGPVDDSAIDEYTWDGVQVMGFGHAHRAGGLAVSIRSDTAWDNETINVTLRCLENDGSLAEADVPVPHASAVSHVEHHSEWIVQRAAELTRIRVRDGRELWQRRGELFPRLIFCDAVADQLTGMPSGHEMLIPVCERLSELEVFRAEWHSGPFAPVGQLRNVAPESEPTLQRFSGERTFRCPDGEERLFSWHLRLRNGWRIYFAESDTVGAVVVGYVGPHRRTVRYP